MPLSSAQDDEDDDDDGSMTSATGEIGRSSAGTGDHGTSADEEEDDEEAEVDEEAAALNVACIGRRLADTAGGGDAN